MKRLRVGFVPLVDAASVVVAARRGFAATEGIEIALSRERSWASVRDKLSVGYLDAAHVLSPMVVASQLGLGNFRSPLIVPIMLSLDGNEVTLSAELAELCIARTGYVPQDADEWGRALASVVRNGTGRGAPPFTFAAVFPFSSHAYLLREWLADAGLDPDRDVNVTVLPPPMMADALAEGLVDGFCAGPPWGGLATERGAGRLAFQMARMRSGVPEKALAVREHDPMREPLTLERLVRAIAASAEWVADPTNTDELCALLAAPDAVGVDASTIRAAIERSGMRLAGTDVLRPDPSHATWIARGMIRWGQIAGRDGVEIAGRAASGFRPDLFDAALGTAPPTNDLPSD